MYWGLWTKDANGEPLEPPYPTSDFLKYAVRKMNNPVLVFDTFASFSSGDENDNAVVGATFRHLRHLTSLGATVLVIHHPAKNGDSNSRCASAMEGAVDAGLKVVGTIEEGEDLAKRSGFRRSTIRDFIDNGIVAGQLKYEKCKLFVKPKEAAVVAKPRPFFDKDEWPKPSVVAAVQ